MKAWKLEFWKTLLLWQRSHPFTMSKAEQHTLIHTLLPYMGEVTSFTWGLVVLHCIYSPFIVLITCLECDSGYFVERESPAFSSAFSVDLECWRQWLFTALSASTEGKFCMCLFLNWLYPQSWICCLFFCVNFQKLIKLCTLLPGCPYSFGSLCNAKMFRLNIALGCLWKEMQLCIQSALHAFCWSLRWEWAWAA